MRRTAYLILAVCLCSSLSVAQFGGREGDVVLYAVSTKGLPDFQVVPPKTVNTQTGFEIKDPLALPRVPFEPDFPGEFYVTLHQELGDSMRFIFQKEGIVTPHNVFQGPGKLQIVEGIDRLLIPNKSPIDLTAGLYAGTVTA
jgi:hypothetical protein